MEIRPRWLIGVLNLTIMMGCASTPEKADEKSIEGETPVASKAKPKPRDIPAEARSKFNEAIATYQQQRKSGNSDYKDLIAKFEGVLDEDGKFAEAHYNLGCIYEAMRDDEKAQDHYRKALEIYPKLALAAANWGAMLARRGKLDEALAVYKRALSEDSKNSVVLLNMAGIYKQQKQFDLAVQVASQVLVRDPKNVGAYRIMAAVYFDKGDLDMAHLICARGLTVKEKDPRLLNTLGLVLLKMKRIPEALVQFRMALEQEPDMIQTRFNVAKVALDYKDFRVAREEFQKILEYDPSNLKAAMGLGIAMRGTGEFEVAKQQFLAIAEKHKKNPVPHYWLCVLALRNFSDNATTITECQKFVEMSGSNLPANHPAFALIEEAKKNIGMDRQVREMEKKAEEEAKRIEAFNAKLVQQRQEIIDREWEVAQKTGEPLPPKKLSGGEVPFVVKPLAITAEKATKVQLIGALFKDVAKVEIGTLKAKWIQVDETILEMEVQKGMGLGGWDIMVTFKDKSIDPLVFTMGLWVAEKPAKKTPSQRRPNRSRTGGLLRPRRQKKGITISETFQQPVRNQRQSGLSRNLEVGE